MVQVFARNDATRAARGIARAALLLSLALSSSACVGKRIVIVDPDDGILSLGQTDDLNGLVAGLQYDVVVDTVDLPIGEPVTVYVGTDPSTLVEEGFGYEGLVEPDRRATVRATLPDGELHLVACAGEDCAHRSPVRRVKVSGSVGLCPLVQFVAPRELGTGTLTLTADADVATTDGACGGEYAIPVRARVDVPNGTSARLWVDGLPIAQATVADHVADFGDVVLGVRGGETSTLTVAIDGQPARCIVEHPRPLAVACPGESCRLVPLIDGPVLGTSLDEDESTPTLETTVTALSASAADGGTYRLLANGSEIAQATGNASSGIFVRAPIPGVSAVAMQAVCPSGSGATRSTIARYAVDVDACGVAFVAPMDGKVFLPADDRDGNTANGWQIEASVELVDADCVGFRVAVCGAIPATGFTDVVGSADGTLASSVATLGTSGSQELCAQGLDRAGNVSTARITVGVAPSGPPMVAVVDPAAGARINRAGGPFAGVDYVADAVPTTPECNVDVTVDCSAIGAPVGLSVDGMTTSVTGACVADASSSLGGRALLRGIALGTSATNHVLIARQTQFGLTGTSTPLAVAADCRPPTLSIDTPICGGFIDASDDVSPNAGIQTQVVVASPNVPQVDVTLTLVRASGTSTVANSPASMLSPGATEHSFSALDFGTNGVARLIATALDDFGNGTATDVCAVTVARSPFIVANAPSTTTFDAGNRAAFDCRPSTGALDLSITGTTSASDGSNVTVQIGDAIPVVTVVVGGAFTACAPAPNGTVAILASVTDDAGLDGVAGSASAAPITIQVVGVGY